jgi:hypothetical protein
VRDTKYDLLALFLSQFILLKKGNYKPYLFCYYFFCYFYFNQIKEQPLRRHKIKEAAGPAFKAKVGGQ